MDCSLSCKMNIQFWNPKPMNKQTTTTVVGFYSLFKFLDIERITIQYLPYTIHNIAYIFSVDLANISTFLRINRKNRKTSSTWRTLAILEQNEGECVFDFICYIPTTTTSFILKSPLINFFDKHSRRRTFIGKPCKYICFFY